MSPEELAVTLGTFSKGKSMFVRTCRRLACKLVAGLTVLCILSAGAFAQSAPPSRPSGSVNIHQVQVAFIGSGAVGGGTLYFRGRSYPVQTWRPGNRGNWDIDARCRRRRVQPPPTRRLQRRLWPGAHGVGRGRAGQRPDVAAKYQRCLSAFEGQAPRTVLKPRSRRNGRPFGLVSAAFLRVVDRRGLFG